MVKRVKCHMEVQKQQTNKIITLLCTSPQTHYLDILPRNRKINPKVISVVYLQRSLH